MKLLVSKCPNCGGSIEFTKDSTSTKCKYCKSTVLLDDETVKINVELSGNINIKNLPQYENYVILGDRYYDDLLFREARTQYRKGLELNPFNNKLIFREKICRSCTMSFDKTDEIIVQDAFDEISKKVNNYQELRQYIKESSTALAYIINKSIEYYQKHNLASSDVIGLHYRISLCAIIIDYLKIFVDDNDDETKLELLEHYISACHLLTQDLSYKIPYSRKRGVFNISYKSRKNYVKNLKKAEKERNQILNNNIKLKKESDYSLPKSDYFYREKAYLYFIFIFILNIALGFIFFNIKAYFELGICIGSFLYLIKRIGYIRNNSEILKEANEFGTFAIILALFILFCI